MELNDAVLALTALSHKTRLEIFRSLMVAGPNGKAAGEIADELNVIRPTMSFHLKELDRAGLIYSWRNQRNIFYAVNIDGMRQLLAFLTDDCCQGHPEICGDINLAKTFCTADQD